MSDGDNIEIHNKRKRENKERRERKLKDSKRSIKLGRVRLKGENQDKYRRGARPSIHSKIWRGLDENEKKKARERRRLERIGEKRKKEKIDDELNIKNKRENKGRIRQIYIKTDLSEEYKKLVLEGLYLINEFILITGTEYKKEEVLSYLNKAEKLFNK